MVHPRASLSEWDVPTGQIGCPLEPIRGCRPDPPKAGADHGMTGLLDRGEPVRGNHTATVTEVSVRITDR
jgi:hypothetical protein